MIKDKTSLMKSIEELISEDTLTEYAHLSGYNPSLLLFSTVETDLRFSVRVQILIESALILGTADSYKCVYNRAVLIQSTHPELEWDCLEQLEQFELRRNSVTETEVLSSNRLERTLKRCPENTIICGQGSRELRAYVKEMLETHRLALLN